MIFLSYAMPYYLQGIDPFQFIEGGLYPISGTFTGPTVSNIPWTAHIGF